MTIKAGGALLSAGDMSGNLTTDVLNMEGQLFAAFTVTAPSATHVGSYVIQESDDQSNWADITFYDSAGTAYASMAVSSGSAVDDRAIVRECTGKYLQLVYTFSSGVGALTVSAFRKRGW